MTNWKEIIKSGVESVEIYSKKQVKVTCTNKDIGEEVFIAIRNNYQNLDAEPLKYIKGTNYKDFRFKFSSTSEAARFLTVLEDIRNGKEVLVAMPFEETAKDTTLATSRPNVVTTTTTPTATTSSGITVKQTLPTATTSSGTTATTTSAGTVGLQKAAPAGSTSVKVTKETLQEVQKKEQEKNEQENGISKKTLLIAGGASVLVIILLVIILKR